LFAVSNAVVILIGGQAQAGHRGISVTARSLGLACQTVTRTRTAAVHIAIIRGINRNRARNQQGRRTAVAAHARGVTFVVPAIAAVNVQLAIIIGRSHGQIGINRKQAIPAVAAVGVMGKTSTLAFHVKPGRIQRNRARG